MAPKPIEELDDFIIMQINDAMLNIIAGERRNLQSGVACELLKIEVAWQ